MFLTEEQLKARLESENNIAVHKSNGNRNALVKIPSFQPEEKKIERKGNVIVEERRSSGLHKGVVHMPPSLREIIGIQANIPGQKSKDIEKAYGVHQQFVSSSKRGKIDGTHLNKDFKEKINAGVEDYKNKLQPVVDMALLKLMDSMKLLDEEKLAKSNARDLSTVASNLSKVITNSIPEHKQQANIQLHIYTPAVKSEDYYDTIEVAVPRN